MLAGALVIVSFCFLRVVSQSHLKYLIVDLVLYQFLFSAFHTACTAAGPGAAAYPLLFVLTNCSRLAVRAAGLVCAWVVYVMTNRRDSSSKWLAEVAQTHGGSCHRLVRLVTLAYVLSFTLPFVLVQDLPQHWLDDDKRCWYNSNHQLIIELGVQVVVFVTTAFLYFKYMGGVGVGGGVGHRQPRPMGCRRP